MSAKKSTLYIALGSLSFLISSYLINIWLGRHLGPRDYGTYGIILSLITIINLIQTNGFPQAASKYIAENVDWAEEIYHHTILLQIVLTIMLAAIYFLLANPIATILNDPSIAKYIQLSTLIVPLYAILATYTGYYNGLHRFNVQSKIQIYFSVVKILFVMLLSYFFGLTGALVGFMIAPIAGLLAGFHLPKKSPIHFPYSKLIVYSLPLVGSALVSTLQQSIDLYLVKALSVANSAAGFYTANQSISKIPFFALAAFSVVIYPSISKNTSQNLHQHSRELIHNSIRAILLLLIPVTLLVSATSSSVLGLLYSDIYLPAAPSLSVLIIGMGFLTVFTLFSNILNGSGEPKIPLLISLIGALTSSMLCFVLIPKYELVGAALATSIGAFVSMVVASYFVYKKFQALVSIPRVLRIVSASLLIYALAKFYVPPLVLLPIYYVALFAVYGFILILMRELTRKDLDQAKELIPAWVPVFGRTI